MKVWLMNSGSWCAAGWKQIKPLFVQSGVSGRRTAHHLVFIEFESDLMRLEAETLEEQQGGDTVFEEERSP